jgi:hypothetical protein
MTERLLPSEEENREFARDILEFELNRYAGRIIVAAEAKRKIKGLEPYVAVAANGLRLITRLPAKRLILESIEQQAGDLAVVEAEYPQLVQRSERNWRALSTATWQTVQFEPDARLPEDHTIYGHIELLAALDAGKAHVEL